MSSFTSPTKRESVDPSLSANEPEQKRSRVAAVITISEGEDEREASQVEYLANGTKKHPSEEYTWAHSYFKTLVEKGHHVNLSVKEIHTMMKQNCGTETVPAEIYINVWLATVKHKELLYNTSTTRPVEEAPASATSASNTFNNGVETNKQIYTRTSTSSMERKSPKERGRRAYKEVPYRSREYPWGYSYFTELVEEGHVNSSSKEILKRMEQDCGLETVPSEYTVRMWLEAKRKELGYEDYPWARNYFNELMEEGHVNSSAIQILALMQENCGDKNPVPPKGNVGIWLTTKRKEVGLKCGEEYLWARLFFNELMEKGHINSSKYMIRGLLKRNSPDEPVPSESTIGDWLAAKRRAG